MGEGPEAERAVHESAEPEIDPEKLEQFLKELRAKQNLPLGAITGAAAAVVGAAIWAGITIVTNYQLGLMAIALGCAVGLTVRKFGQGIDKTFGIVGCIEALVGCLLGNLLTICAVISNHQDIPFLVVLSRLTPDLVVTLMSRSFDFMDLVFYGIAAYEGYKFSFRPVHASEISNLSST